MKVTVDVDGFQPVFFIIVEIDGLDYLQSVSFCRSFNVPFLLQSGVVGPAVAGGLAGAALTGHLSPVSMALTGYVVYVAASGQLIPERLLHSDF